MARFIVPGPLQQSVKQEGCHRQEHFMAHETHGIDTAVENIYPRPQQTLARVNISSLGVINASCHRNTTSSDVATRATPGRNGKYLSFSTTRPPPSSAIMNCTTKAVNVTYHELVDKLFHSYC